MYCSSDSLGMKENEGGYANIIVLMNGTVIEAKQVTPKTTLEPTSTAH